MTVTPMPIMNETTLESLNSFVQFANTSGSGFLGYSILFLFMGVSFLASSQLTFTKRALATLFMGSVAAAFLTAAGILAAFVAPILFVLAFLIFIVDRGDAK